MTKLEEWVGLRVWATTSRTILPPGEAVAPGALAHWERSCPLFSLPPSCYAFFWSIFTSLDMVFASSFFLNSGNANALPYSCENKYYICLFIHWQCVPNRARGACTQWRTTGLSLFLPSCEPGGLNAGWQSWLQMHLPAEPSFWSSPNFRQWPSIPGFRA